MTPTRTAYSKPDNTMPSMRRRPGWAKCLEGMIDVWRVSHRTQGDHYEFAGYYAKEGNAWLKADEMYKEGKRAGLRVEHKAGINVNGKLFLVNIKPIQLSDSSKEPNTADYNEGVAAERFIADFIGSDKPTSQIVGEYKGST